MANNQLLASDNFASGSLAAGWSPLNGFSAPQVVSGTPNVIECNATGGTPAGIVWTGLTWPNDHTSEITVQALTKENSSNLYIFVRWRASSGSGTGYYAVLTDNGGTQSVGIFRDDAGTGTQLGSFVAVTVAAGDIWTFQAAGAVLSVYQNGNRVMFQTDVTYLTGGSPAVLMQAGTALSHAQISSWRGYSAIQQDGIWQKQGVVLPPNATDLSSSGYGVYEGTCIYDTNPQLIAGTNVYKLWFSGGAGGSQNTYYAESPDLKTWTRKATAVITAFVSPQVIKVGNTYYLYCQANSAQGTGNTAYYTSSDGVTWTQQSTNVLSLGAAGHWDAASIYPLKPIAVINGTWYALYGGFAASSNGLSKVGLVTSTDGAGAVWTKYAGNPVISRTQTTYPYACFAKVGNTYYVWMQVGPQAAQNSGGSFLFDPTECARFSTTDFINWSNPVPSLHHSQMNEAVNTPVNNTEAVGGVGPIAIFDINGKANMLYGGSQGDSISPVDGQYQLAIGPAPIASIVTANEDAVQQTVSDNFSRAPGAIGPNWTTVDSFGTFKIVSGNLVEPTNTATNAIMVYTGAAFGSSLYSEITVSKFVGGAGNIMTPGLGLASGAFYYLSITSGTGSQGFVAGINYYDGSTNHIIGPSVGITLNVGDVLRLSVIQSAVGDVISFFQNGTLITQVVNTGVSVSGLYPGMYMQESSAGNAQVSLWAGGNANVIPNYPPTSGASSSWLTTALTSSLRGLRK